MDLAIERFQCNGFTVVLYQDPEPPDLRKDYDNLTTLACWHRQYYLGDRQIEGMRLKDMVKMLKDEGEKVLAIMPLYLYEHSGMTMCACRSNLDRPRTRYPFDCRWDAGQVGWGYVTEAQAIKMGCTPGETYKGQQEDGVYDKAFFENAIIAEVEAYDMVMTGQVYGYQITDEDGDDVDSCWGFIGDIDYVRKEAREAAESAEPIGKVHGGCTASCEGGVET